MQEGWQQESGYWKKNKGNARDPANMKDGALVRLIRLMSHIQNVTCGTKLATDTEH